MSETALQAFSDKLTSVMSLVSKHLKGAFLISFSILLFSACDFEQPEVSESDLWHRYTHEAETGNIENAISILTYLLEQFPENVDAYVSRGYFFCLINQPALAIEDCQQAILLAPEKSQTYNNLALAYHLMNEQHLAMSSVNMAIELDAENAYAFKNRAKIHMALGNRYEACQDLYTASLHGYNDTFSKFENDLNSLFLLNCEIVERMLPTQ
ncbi:MAG: hypothetical protein AAF655_17450 [Bacteroidota bacterium]